ncbi:aspartate beta-hydroxylase domain-containing protein 2-like [Diadema setosum]|uniref:aspartate beta-hydroxylase domain-containing protein 2-like n=1 Tax=Diadema setosum TaxID=31175 RepID=UPI003B3B255A
MNEEDERNHRPSLSYSVSAFIGLVILLWITWRSWRCGRKVSSQDRKNSDDFTKCSSPDCVRCWENGNHGSWTVKLDTFMAMQPSEGRERLEDLRLSFQSNIQERSAGQKGDLNQGSSRMQNPTTFLYEKLRTPPWFALEDIFDISLQSDIRLLENRAKDVREDFDRLYMQYVGGDGAGWATNNVPTGSWIVFHLWNQGRKIEENCGRCPRTVSILEQLESRMSGVSFGYACFSVLRPGSHITPHYGPCNLRIRCHLGLHIPERCSLTVAGETRRWREGECLLFDDSYLHEAENAGDGAVSSGSGPRAILMVDFWNPDLTIVEREALNYVFASP